MTEASAVVLLTVLAAIVVTLIYLWYHGLERVSALTVCDSIILTSIATTVSVSL